jgi:hypothetical protein
LLRHGTLSGEQIFAEVMDETDPRLITAAELIVGAAVRAVADETMEDALARAIAVRAGRRPDSERLLFAIVDGLEDYKLTAPAFVLRQAQRVLCAPAVARRSLASAARKVGRDPGDGMGDFTADVPLYVEP